MPFDTTSSPPSAVKKSFQAFTAIVASFDGFFPSTVAVAFTTSFSFGSLPFGTSAVHFPSPSAVVFTFVPSGSSTSTFAFGSEVPVIVLSPAFGAVISGFAVCSVSVSSTTLIFALTSSVESSG